MSIRFFSRGLIVGAVVIMALVLGLGFASVREASGVIDRWRSYQDATDPSAVLLADISAAIGFGGMIHDFKNYVLRKDAPRARRVAVNVARIQADLERYRLGETDPELLEALDKIEGVVSLYETNLAVVTEMAAAGASAAEIDETVQISDGPALEGLTLLRQKISASRLSERDMMRDQLIFDIRSALGFGGMIHHFKNYVLRQDQPRIARIEASIAEARAAVAEYEMMDPNVAERDALAMIAGVIDAYQVNIDAVTQLAAQGASPETVDAEVKVSDGPALEGLNVLTREYLVRREAESSQVEAAQQNAIRASTALAAISIVGFLAVIALTVAVMARRIAPAADRVARGIAALVAEDGAQSGERIDLDDLVDPRTEIGRVAGAYRQLVDAMAARERLEAEARDALVTREQRARLIEKSVAEFRAAASRTMQQTQDAVQRLGRNAQDLDGSANETKTEAVAAAGTVEETIRAIETVAAATEELSASIESIGSDTEKSRAAADGAVTQVEHLNGRVDGLSTAVSKIGEVVELIRDVAEQTNLLALNATIEAARAGEAGKGFAVVAGEVKNLASQTQKATEDITTQITEIQTVSGHVVEAVRKIGVVIEDLNAVAMTIRSAVSQQESTTQQISSNAQSLSTDARSISDRITGVTRAAEANSTLSGEVGASTDMVTQSAVELEAAIQGFMTVMAEVYPNLAADQKEAAE